MLNINFQTVNIFIFRLNRPLLDTHKERREEEQSTLLLSPAWVSHRHGDIVTVKMLYSVS